MSELKYNTETLYRCPKCRNYSSEKECPNHPRIEIEVCPPGTILGGTLYLKVKPSLHGVIYDK